MFNALRFITKNVLAVAVQEQRAIEWHNQYLVMPLDEPMYVRAGDEVVIQLTYEAGAEIDAFAHGIAVTPTRRVAIAA